MKSQQTSFNKNRSEGLKSIDIKINYNLPYYFFLFKNKLLKHVAERNAILEINLGLRFSRTSWITTHRCTIPVQYVYIDSAADFF